MYNFIKEFNIDPHNFIIISSLANEVFNQKDYYTNFLHGIVCVIRKFFSHNINDSSCMCTFNKQWHITSLINDFGAVSLYPSVIKSLYTFEGIPKVISSEQFNMVLLSATSIYVVESKITKVNKLYQWY